MNTPEQKVANDLANLAESHWFNPASLGRELANQPLYTVDRMLELVVHILKAQSVRHEIEKANGVSSEGLLFATELNRYIKHMSGKYRWKHIKIPK